MEIIKDNYNSEREVTCGKCGSVLLVDPKKDVWSDFDINAPGYYKYIFSCPLCYAYNNFSRQKINTNENN